MRKTRVFMNKPVYLVLSISDQGRTVMYEIWYDYDKPKYGNKGTDMDNMDTDSFIFYIKTDIFKDIAEDVETRFDTSRYELDSPLLKKKKK